MDLAAEGTLVVRIADDRDIIAFRREFGRMRIVGNLGTRRHGFGACRDVLVRPRCTLRCGLFADQLGGHPRGASRRWARKSTRLNSSHYCASRMTSSAVQQT